MEILFSILIVISVSFIFQWWNRRRRDPPGPWGLPYIGSMIHLSNTNIFEEFEKYRKKYGDVFSLRVGNFDVIVINGYQIIQEALKRDELLGRPDFEIWKIRNFGVRSRGILACDGNKVWSEQRRFTLKNLRDFGFGKQGMESLLQLELQELISCLDQQIGSPISLCNTFNASVLNSLWYIITGRRFELDNPEFKTMIELLGANMRASGLVGPALYFPEPAKYNLIKRGLWKKLKNVVLMRTEFLTKVVDLHLNTVEEDVDRDLIDVYIKQMKTSVPGSSFYSEEGRKNLLVTINDLFVAGSETTSTTLLWAILYLCQNPRVQANIQAEIDIVVGADRLPGRDDKPKMVYVEAVLNEVHRKCSLLPFSVFHSVLEDCEFKGFRFRTGTIIYPNFYEAHHNVNYWKDPENFRPERFLDKTKTTLLKHEPFMPFSKGKRACLGEVLARDTLFIFLTGLLQVFTFRLDPEFIGVSTEPQSQTFVLSPNPFKVIIEKRQQIIK